MIKGGGASRPRLRLLPTVLLTAAILALPTAVYAWGRSSSSFEIRRVTVSGTRVESQRRVHRLLRREFRGRNLFAVTSADVSDALSSLRFIETAKVDRDFPHTLRVRVVEHRPQAYALAAGRWYVLADDGYVVCAVGKEPGAVAVRRAGSATTPASAASTPRPGTEATGTPVAETSARAATGPGTAASAPPTAKGTPSATATPTAQATDAQGSPVAVATMSAAAQRGLLAKGPAGAELRLPRLAVSGALKPGTMAGDDTVVGAMAVLAGLPAGIRRHVEVGQLAGRQLTLLLEGGLEVVWGTQDRSLAKTVALEVVLDRYRRAGREPTFIDVAVPDTVLARPILK